MVIGTPPRRRRRSRGKVGISTRVLGIDDGPAPARRRGNVMVVGTVYRGGDVFEGLLSTRVRYDGANATRKLIEMVKGSKFHPQLQAMMLDGIALGGFNILDLDRLYRALELPIVVVMRRPPDLSGMRCALEQVAGSARKIALLKRAGTIHPIDVAYPPGADGSGSAPEGTLYCQLRGLSPQQAGELLNVTCTRGKVPEPIRAAHLIASGVVLGESGKRA